MCIISMKASSKELDVVNNNCMTLSFLIVGDMEVARNVAFSNLKKSFYLDAVRIFTCTD